MTLDSVIKILFSASLFFNAIFFIPQAYRLFKVKDAKGLSLLTFFGFNLMQIFTAWHGLITHDYILFTGFLLSLLTCGCVTVMIIYYRYSAKRNKHA